MTVWVVKTKSLFLLDTLYLYIDIEHQNNQENKCESKTGLVSYRYNNIQWNLVK